MPHDFYQGACYTIILGTEKSTHFECVLSIQGSCSKKSLANCLKEVPPSEPRWSTFSGAPVELCLQTFPTLFWSLLCKSKTFFLQVQRTLRNSSVICLQVINHYSCVSFGGTGGSGCQCGARHLRNRTDLKSCSPACDRLRSSTHWRIAWYILAEGIFWSSLCVSSSCV